MDNEFVRSMTEIASVMISAGTLSCTVFALLKLNKAGEKLEVIHKQTNSLTEKLVEATGDAKFAAGVSEGIAKSEAERQPDSARATEAAAIAASAVLSQAADQAAILLVEAAKVAAAKSAP